MVSPPLLCQAAGLVSPPLPAAGRFLPPGRVPGPSPADGQGSAPSSSAGPFHPGPQPLAGLPGPARPVPGWGPPSAESPAGALPPPFGGPAQLIPPPSELRCPNPASPPPEGRSRTGFCPPGLIPPPDRAGTPGFELAPPPADPHPGFQSPDLAAQKLPLAPPGSFHRAKSPKWPSHPLFPF